MNYRKAQGAMEYLMTYGWAILVIMVVGIVMWNMGIFNMGGGTTTYTGFTTIKPMLSACSLIVEDNLMSVSGGAFYCTFTNNAGAPIFVKQLEVKIDNQCCGYNWLAINENHGPMLLSQTDSWEDPNNCEVTAIDCYDSEEYPGCSGDEGDRKVRVGNGESFVVITNNGILCGGRL
jgi:hypothetical protein